MTRGILDKQIGYLLRRAQMTTFAELIELLAPLDLRPAQFTLLKVLETSSGLSQSEAAALLAIKNANFAVLVSGLEKRGLVRRKARPTDRRERRLYLTPKGIEVAREAGRISAEYEGVLSRRLGGAEATAAFLSMLIRVAQPTGSDADQTDAKEEEST